METSIASVNWTAYCLCICNPAGLPRYKILEKQKKLTGNAIIWKDAMLSNPVPQNSTLYTVHTQTNYLIRFPALFPHSPFLSLSNIPHPVSGLPYLTNIHHYFVHFLRRFYDQTEGCIQTGRGDNKAKRKF